MSDLSIIRRIAERGMKNASHQVDCWQHLLDELERVPSAERECRWVYAGRYPDKGVYKDYYDTACAQLLPMDKKESCPNCKGKVKVG
jgi:hypothetical protein